VDVPFEHIVSLRFFTLDFTFGYFLFNVQTADVADVPLLSKSEENVEFVIVFGQCAAKASVEGGVHIFVNTNEFLLLYREQLYASLLNFS
jgi:hypothetical protein